MRIKNRRDQTNFNFFFSLELDKKDQLMGKPLILKSGNTNVFTRGKEL